MAILTRPASIQKNVAGSFTMNYAEVAALSVVPEGYYKNTNNWKEVFLKMKHDSSKQYGTIHFLLPGNAADLITSETSRSGSWEVETIMIRDYDKGEIIIKREDIPEVANYDLLIVSAASHGDLNIGNGETVEIPSGGKRQYGDLIVASGGTLKLADGGGITELEVLGNCRIDGLIDAVNGQHLSGTWNATTVLGESITHDIVQQAGGIGGGGEGVIGSVRTPSTGFSYTLSGATTTWRTSTNGVIVVYWKGTHFIYWGPPGYEGNGIEINVPGEAVTPDGTTFYKGTLQFIDGSGQEFYSLYRVGDELIQAEGGSPASGNGGGGGRSAQFGALDGFDASSVEAGVGAGQDDPAADEFGETGAHSVTQSEAGSGGFRGMHGQALFIKARRIDGVGTINASGQKGGNGGNGAEYLSEGSLFGNGAGGGAAGGCGGNIWLRYKSGTPSLTLNVAAGERGTAGTNISGAGTAAHGDAGSVGSTDSQSYL